MKQKKPTFSKTLLIVDYAVAIILVAIAIIYAFQADSYSNSIAGMVDAWIGQAAVSTGFYMWKAKCENRAKYAQEWLEKCVKDPNFSIEKCDAAIRMTELITKD